MSSMSFACSIQTAMDPKSIYVYMILFELDSPNLISNKSPRPIVTSFQKMFALLDGWGLLPGIVQKCIDLTGLETVLGIALA